MAVLSHNSFADEEANGVAISANIFDTTGLEPGFYINVQKGDMSVVLPDPGVVSDQIIYYYDSPGQPVVYLAHSNLVPPGETVLTNVELNELGRALAAIRAYFLPVYGSTGGFYGMDTEFKFDEGQLWMKQARPYPGWNALSQ
jgi:pyruvate,water dikinase